MGFVKRYKGAEVLFRQDTLPPEETKGLPPVFELSWNHTTLRALRDDPSITYLQVLYPFPNQVDLVEKIHERFGDELPAHLEFVKFDGKVTCFGLPLVRFTTEERLEEIMKIHEDMGAPIFNPHRYTLEEGGMKQTDEVQLAFKREADPQGLLNPGKMIAWEDPDYDPAPPPFPSWRSWRWRLSSSRLQGTMPSRRSAISLGPWVPRLAGRSASCGNRFRFSQRFRSLCSRPRRGGP
jgi:hypothetical protein